MNLLISYNLQKDIQNWKSSIKKSNYNVRWIKFLPSNISVKCVDDNECLKKYLEINYPTNKIDEFINLLNKLIKQKEIQNDLENLLDSKFKTDNFKIFITTFHRAPYNTDKNYFYLIYRENNIKKTISEIYHELMHFLFHQNYWEFCQKKGLKENEIHILKESFTVLLNEVLEKRKLALDKGYAAHQELREKIKNYKKSSNDFKELLTKIVNEIYKNNKSSSDLLRV